MKIFKNIAMIFAIAASAFTMTGCGERVQIESNQIGKVLTPNGFEEKIRPASSFRLPACFVWESGCSRLVTLDVADITRPERLIVLMPEDKLNMEFSVQTTLTPDAPKTGALFSSLPQVDGEPGDSVTHIVSKTIYDTYAKNLIQTEAQAFMSRYNIAFVSSNLDSVSSELRKHLTKQIESRTPFKVKSIGLTDVKYPDVIVASQLNAAQRREDIEKEKAELEVTKVRMNKELTEAQLARQIEKEKAETAALSQQLQSRTITAQTLEQDRIKVQQTLADAAVILAKNTKGSLPQVVSGGSMPLQELMTQQFIATRPTAK